MTLYAKYQATGKYVQGDDVLVASNTVEVHHTAQGFFCESPELGQSPIYDVSDSRDAVHKFVRTKGFYLVRVKEVDIYA